MANFSKYSFSKVQTTSLGQWSSHWGEVKQDTFNEIKLKR